MLRKCNINDDKVTFGVTSKGKPSLIYKNYEFFKHRQYANGNTQWRCNRYQSKKCRARLTTKNNEITGNRYPQHNHDSKIENILARQAVAEMKDEMKDVSATATAVIGSVSTQLHPDVLMALPKKVSLKRTLHRKRQKLQFDSGKIKKMPIINVIKFAMVNFLIELTDFFTALPI